MRVIVVGAGVIGSAVAWRLASRGVQVTVVDPAPGQGASRAAAGMLTPVGELWHGEQALLTLLVASARRYAGFVAEVEAASGLGTGYRTTRTLICGTDSADRAVLADLHTLAEQAGLRSEELTTRAARRLEPGLTPRLTCAFLAPDDHQVDPRMLVPALLAAVESRGGEVVAAAVGSLADGPSVVLDDGRALTADAVVLASGVAAGALDPVLRGLRPVYGDILRLGPSRDGRPLVEGVVRGSVSGRPVYLVPRADGSVVLGATMREDADPRVNLGGVHQLLRDAVTLVPGIVDCSLDEVLARPRPGTPDNLPLLGTLAPGVVAATGFHRHGVVLAPLAADAVAAALGLDGGDLPDLSPCAPGRFAVGDAGPVPSPEPEEAPC